MRYVIQYITEYNPCSEPASYFISKRVPPYEIAYPFTSMLDRALIFKCRSTAKRSLAKTKILINQMDRGMFGDASRSLNPKGDRFSCRKFKVIGYDYAQMVQIMES